MPVDRRGRVGEAGWYVVDAKNREARGEREPPLGEDGDGAPRNGAVDERASVVVLATTDDEEIPGRDASRVMVDAEASHRGVTLHVRAATRNLAREIGERHPISRAGFLRELARGIGHDAG